MPVITFQYPDGRTQQIEAAGGMSVMQAAKAAGTMASSPNAAVRWYAPRAMSM
jgi:hypothetical protein